MTFRKGTSGNPGGKSGRVLELVHLARESCEAAIKTAVEILKTEGEDPKTKLAAAVFLRDTGMGRPAQQEFDVAQLSDEALIAEVRRRTDAKRVGTSIEPAGVSATDA